MGDVKHKTTLAKVADLKRHPRNYREHPDDQIQHLAESIREHGLYRNVVVARENTILAGHGVVLAARSLGLEKVPVVRLDLDPEDPRALKVLTGDNEIEHLAEQDDRLLSELLKEIATVDVDGLLGTGYDEMMLANLAFVTRPASEIRDFDAAAQWAGMPEYQEGGEPPKLIVSFRSEEDRSKLLRLLEAQQPTKARASDTLSIWWPARERDDLASVQFQG